ncbi:FAD-dependent oxidoreductase, partial [Pseudoxanthomonas sp. SGD-10]
MQLYMRRLLFGLFILFNFSAKAQFKTDVLVIGGSASGSAAAIQAARSGVKVTLLEKGNYLIADGQPELDVPAFETGIWKEWKDSCKKDIDSLQQTDARLTLEEIVKKTKNLQYFKNLQILSVRQKGKGWEVAINRGSKKETVRAKILVVAEFSAKNNVISEFNLLPLTDGKINGLAVYNSIQRANPYKQPNKVYRTSGATGFGKDFTSLHFIPMGAFIPKENPSILVANHQALIDGFSDVDLKNIALWTNIGQMIGALAAYGPFFDTTPDKANIRLTQGEIINFKNVLYPVLDVDPQSYSWIPIQKMIASQILKHDFITGKFHPDSIVLKEDLREILSELHPRSRIWFLENTGFSKLSIKEAVSLLSFISGKEEFSIHEELKTAWESK